MLCFTLASHKSLRAWHLSGLSSWNAASNASHWNPRFPRQMEGLTCHMSIEKLGHSILARSFNKVQAKQLKEKAMCSCVDSSLSCKPGNRRNRIHSTSFRVNMIFTLALYKVLTKLNTNKSRISIGALQFYWVWQHCQNTTGAASSNNVEVGNKLLNDFLCTVIP